MSFHSLLISGLLASVAVAVPKEAWGITVTETKTVSTTIIATVTELGTCSSTITSPTSDATTTTTSSATNTNPTTTLLATPQPSNWGLNNAARADGKLWFGTAADIPGLEQDDRYYMKEYNNTHDFGGTTPANIMKFMFTEPEQNVFNFTGAQEFLDIAFASHKLVRCHNLIWQSELPTWVTNPTTNWTNETLSKVLQNHVYTLVSHFGDQCYSWDVVNEALSDDPAGSYQNNIWFDTIGPEYVAMAFEYAEKAVKDHKLNVKLYYNDYNIEYPGPKSTAAQNIVKELKARNIQIDGVGLESHFIAGETPSQATQITNMADFTSLDIDVAVTELDVRLYLPPNATSEAQQVADYYATVAACAATERCIGITVWDFDDTYSWVPSTFAGQGYADLFFQPDGPNTPLVKKAAYDGCLQALQHKAESP
ncbi:glycoside hydrolase family 10 protein [Acidomyces richmondensis BFW]|uniref:Beta-xylanase n=2 Tax=Bispora sp. MEY-1 TaxID=554688 RepID=D0QF43_9HELO|nr:family-10 endo-beta-1,4-xylanase [Bispora sp. MEY-1]KXL48666.1 MAG: glycoside hydrolase family 10 protein [Acidomyces sp. 'richmondensis']KYG47466.1 glycoside hydrolase family 10 protein [Acidomyces richmondensis BFW]